MMEIPLTERFFKNKKSTLPKCEPILEANLSSGQEAILLRAKMRKFFQLPSL